MMPLGKIGSFGNVVFEVSTKRIRTFDQLSRTVSARWVDQQVLNKKPITEFEGPDLDQITFNMLFDAHFGVNPSDEMKKLRDICKNGQAQPLVIGSQVLGKWVCLSVTENWKVVDGRGRLVKGEVQVTLKEYV